MSSMVALVIKGGIVAAGISGLALSGQAMERAVAPVVAPIATGMQELLLPPQMVPAPVPAASREVVQPIAADPIAAPIAEWKRLQQSDNWPFSDYANFLLAHPGWPGERSRRAAAETILGSGAEMPQLVTRFFERFPPLTAAGHLRYAEALQAGGRSDAARDQARQAWRLGVLRTADEARLIGGFAGAIGPADHDARMDALLWQGATSAGQRQLALTSPARRATFAARLAFRTNAADAAVLGDAVDDAGRNEAGYIADRATWLRNAGQSAAARAYLAQPRRLTALPGNIEKWYEVLLTQARAAAADRQYTVAYDIARQVDDAFAAGTDVSTQSLGVRDDYTSLVWLAGQTAMKSLGRPNDAIGMFARYAGGSRTPQTRSKGFYWAGRAAEAAGDRATANGYYAQAAAYSDLFYGQLAAERTGMPLKAPPPSSTAGIDAATRTAFLNREIVRATEYLGRTGNRQDQSLFVRQIAQDATTPADHALAAEFARRIDRLDLGVMVGRSAQLNGLAAHSAAGFPSVKLPDSQRDYFTIIHAIARQESQFDRAAVSRAGARGLMQLMPGTARETAGKLGLGYDVGALTSNPDYNIQLGSSYIQRMLDYYGGSYPLAVAAYNAGPGNVNKWIKANGDPRMPGVDMIDWIEAIPIFETRNYVQRVLENAVVYDLMHPAYARSRGTAQLSWYLGKQRPG